MCGIVGAATMLGGRVRLTDAEFIRMRDRLAHRGPDGAGVWWSANRHVALAHRRLAVIDTSAAAAQPMLTTDGLCAITYNGELYNDADLRRELEAEGVAFRTRSDTETVLHALVRWGEGALRRLRGMFALAFYDGRSERLTLARDPMGIKPLFWHMAGGVGLGDRPELTFASEVCAICEHPEIAARPDPVTISAYMTTIRTTLGERTLFAGIRTVLPGEAVSFDLRTGALRRQTSGSDDNHPVDPHLRFDDAVAATRAAVEESVRLHLRSDVPACALLSGGLDSSIVTRCAQREWGKVGGRVRTYCAGSADGSEDSDLSFARRTARAFGTDHAEALVDRAMFLSRWPEMVAAMGMPLGTPNEVAINAVARRLRADGQIVALSGEGADELFAGYDRPLTEALAFESGLRLPDAIARARARAEFHLRSVAWVQPEAKSAILADGVRRASEGDEAMKGWYADEFAAAEQDRGPGASPLELHLRLQRRVNLVGLLARLDSATMLEAVEGRTPFADVALARLAESHPIGLKISLDTPGESITHTKRTLREAFRADLPAEVVERPKASFPLPFQGWLDGAAPRLRDSRFAREIFTLEAIQTVCADPNRLWQWAWPMMNLAIWGDDVFA